MIIHYLCTTLLFVFINMQRIVLFDIAKALCIVLVVVGHYFPENSPVWYECLNKLIYSFHMPLFMFASGFIYMATKKEGESYSKFLVKKLKRLMLPYVVVSVIVISIKMLTEKHAFADNIGDKLYNLFVPHHIRGRCKGCLTKIRAHSA